MTAFGTWDAMIDWFIANCLRGYANTFAQYRPVTVQVYSVTGEVETCSFNGRRWTFTDQVRPLARRDEEVAA